MPDINDVFISYSHEDKNFVVQIENALLEKGLKVWRDKTRLKPGAKFSDEIIENIQNSSIGLCIISESYLNSQWCNQEVGAIKANKSYLFPFF